MGEFTLTKDQRNALDVLNSGENVFLTGEAGTGKSFVLNKFINNCRKIGKKVLVCAPTGIAAINVRGATLHRTFKIPIQPIKPDEYNYAPGSAVVNADVIVIDEISMCRFDVFEYVIKTIKQVELAYSKNKQIVVCGDFFQLSPVITEKDSEILRNLWKDNFFEDGFAFHSKYWGLLNFKNIVLKTVVRQDDAEFKSNLNKARTGDLSCIQWFNESASRTTDNKAIYICGLNKTAEDINNARSEELKTKEVVYLAKTVGKVNENEKIAPEVLKLKVGMRVMSLINDTSDKFQNGSLGTVEALGEKEVFVSFDNGSRVAIDSHEWEIMSYSVNGGNLELDVIGSYEQIPLKIAYAVTIHKSQGQTYDRVNIFPKCFANGQLYVALSRARGIKDINLVEDIKYWWLKTSNEVKNFYNNL